MIMNLALLTISGLYTEKSSKFVWQMDTELTKKSRSAENEARKQCQILASGFLTSGFLTRFLDIRFLDIRFVAKQSLSLRGYRDDVMITQTGTSETFLS